MGSEIRLAFKPTAHNHIIFFLIGRRYYLPSQYIASAFLSSAPACLICFRYMNMHLRSFSYHVLNLNLLNKKPESL